MAPKAYYGRTLCSYATLQTYKTAMQTLERSFIGSYTPIPILMGDFIQVDITVDELRQQYGKKIVPIPEYTTEISLQMVDLIDNDRRLEAVVLYNENLDKFNLPKMNATQALLHLRESPRIIMDFSSAVMTNKVISTAQLDNIIREHVSSVAAYITPTDTLQPRMNQQTPVSTNSPAFPQPFDERIGNFPSE